MKILTFVAVLLLVVGIAKADVILGTLAVSSLLFAGAVMLAEQCINQQSVAS
ncbi:hypothetical protein [Pseudomonas kitaguniensis]|uniref:hypothetical protein n=1 Tax=Pseudomonas kitaguniensis TaxID=2607908 RepID=UPI003B9E7815